MLVRVIRVIRRQPKPVRDQYAFWGAGVFTALVAGVWLLGGLPGAVSTIAGTSEQTTPATDTQTASALTSFQDTINSFQSDMETLREGVASDDVATDSAVDLAEDTATTTDLDTDEAAATTSTTTETAPISTPPVEVRIATFTSSSTVR